MKPRRSEYNNNRGDELRLSSHVLSRRRGGGRPRFEKLSDYYAASDEVQSYYESNSNDNTVKIIERTPDYKVETRGGDTFIEFARSGEAQGKLAELQLV